MTPKLIGAEIEGKLSWPEAAAAIEAGHALPRAEIADSFLYRGNDTLLSRAAWIDGLGALVKTAVVIPSRSIDGGVSLFNDQTGALDAVIDFKLVTKWKTVADSLLGASKLARPDSARILIVGAGTVAANLREAYATLFPDAEFSVWNRSPEGAQILAGRYPGTTVAPDLQAAVEATDIVACATMTTEPILRGAWLQPGQHVDLIGAYRPDMREVDDDALLRSRIFVDSRATTIDHIGELKLPIAAGVITPDDVLADYYDMPSGAFARASDTEITLFKNGGGAHLDLMISQYILDQTR